MEGDEENVEVLQRKKIKKPTPDSIQNTDTTSDTHTTIHDVTQTGNPDAVIINPDISEGNVISTVVVSHVIN